jgi:membrane-associated phospholipid phosphatase
MRGPFPSHLGFHRLTLIFVIAQLALLALTAVSFLATGLQLEWRELADGRSVAILLIWAMWLFYGMTRGQHERKWVATETFLVVALLLTFSLIGSPLQYALIAFRGPLADAWLAQADAAIGVHVPTLVSWTAAHPWFESVLVAAYGSLLLQFVLPPVVLGIRYRDRKALWEYAWHFQVCLVAALIGLALFPAACAFTYYGFESLLDQTRFITQFEALRNGAMSVVHPRDLEGMITFPSFHAAGGMLITWAFRRYRGWAIALGTLNVLLIAATVLTGAHYAIDVIASVAVFAGSVWLWRRVAVHWIAPAATVATPIRNRDIAA